MFSGCGLLFIEFIRERQNGTDERDERTAQFLAGAQKSEAADFHGRSLTGGEVIHSAKFCQR